MTIALYRRYRPDTFAALIGQDHVTGPLRAALRANRVTHAYLFSGPRGCGKTTSARIMARCLNCEQGPTDTPCGTCASCRELATGGPGSLDVVEIDAASHGGVDDTRELRERATFAPVRDRYKVFIIDEAHMVSPAGFNALLKLVEEPPEHVKFIFATTEPERVIGTIRSRTHHYPFRLVPPDVLGPYLSSLLDEEHVSVGSGVLEMVMRAGGGSVRDTLSVLDQLVAGSVEGEVTYETAVSLLGYTDTHLLDEIVAALAQEDGAAVYRVVERTVDSGHDPRRFVEDLLQRLRDLLIIAVAGDEAADALVGVPSDQFDRMKAQAASWGSRALSRAADLTDEALRQMVGATSPRLQLELFIARLLVPVSTQAERDAGETAQPGSHTSASGGVSREGLPSGSFGPKEAREHLQRSRASRTNQAPAASSAPAPAATNGRTVPGAASAPGVPSVSPGAWSSSSASNDEHSKTPGHEVGPHSTAVPAASGWSDVVVSVAGAGASDTPPSARSVEPVAPHAASLHPSEEQSAREESSVEQPPVLSSVSTVPAEPSQPVQVVPQGPPPSESPSIPEPEVGQDPRTHQANDHSALVRERWPQILDRLAELSRATWSLVKGHATPGLLEAGVLVLSFPTDALARNMDRADRAAAVSDAVCDITELRVQVRTRVGSEPAPSPVAAPVPVAAQDANSGIPEEPRPFDAARHGDDWSGDTYSGEESMRREGVVSSQADREFQADRETVLPREAAPEVAPVPAVSWQPEQASQSGDTAPDTSHGESEPVTWPEVAPIETRAHSHASKTSPRSEQNSGRPSLSVFSYEDDGRGVDSAPEPEGREESSAENGSASSSVTDSSLDAPIQESTSALESPSSPSASAQWEGPKASDAQVPGNTDSVELVWPTPAPVDLDGWNTAPLPGGGASLSFEDEDANSSSDVSSDVSNTHAPTIDDSASLDDENIETTTRLGLPVVLEVLGGTIVDEIYDEGGR